MVVVKGGSTASYLERKGERGVRFTIVETLRVRGTSGSSRLRERSRGFRHL